MKNKMTKYIKRGKYDKIRVILEKNREKGVVLLEDFVSSLKEDELYLIENLKNTKIFDEYLEKRNLTLTSDNLVLFFCASDDFFEKELIDVFDKDFNFGVEIISNCELHSCKNVKEKVSNLVDKNKELLIEIAKNKGFVISENGVILNYLPQLFFISLNNDFELTNKIMNSEDFKGPKNFLDSFLKENIDLSKLENVNVSDLNIALSSLDYDAHSFMGKSYSKLSYESQSLLIDLRIRNIFEKSPALVPQYVLESEAFLDEVIRSEEEKNIIRMVTKKGDYSTSEEQKLLSYYHSESSSVEQHLKDLANSSSTRENMTLFDCLCLTMYAKKLLSRNNIKDYKINTFSYSDDIKALGGVVSEELDIYVNNEALTVERVLHTLFHEVEHAKQMEAINLGKIEMDPDIATYQKDRILQRLIGREEYYIANYRNISFEFDADIKAEILCAEFLGKKDQLLKKYIQFGKDELVLNQRYLNTLKRNIHYVDSRIRVYNGKKVKLERLFLQKVGEYMAKGNSISSLIPEESILWMEYSFFPSIQRKSIPELFKIANKIKNNEALQDKYLKIIEQRLIKENDVEYKENILFLTEVIKKEKCPSIMRDKIKVMLNQLNEVLDIKSKKYLDVSLKSNNRNN